MPLRTFIENCQLPKGCKLIELDKLSYDMVCYNFRSTINLHNCNLNTSKNTKSVKNKTFTLMLIEKTEKTIFSIMI